MTENVTENVKIYLPNFGFILVYESAYSIRILIFV